jgi:hypothetical protein
VDTVDANIHAFTGPKPYELLLKELDERNQYARLVAQGYIAWYTFFVTSNLVIIGLSLTSADKVSPIRPYLIALFILVNLLAILATLAMACASAIQNARVNKVINELKASCIHSSGSAPRVEMSSPYPHPLFMPLLAMLVMSLGGITFFWCAFLWLTEPLLFWRGLICVGRGVMPCVMR